MIPKPQNCNQDWLTMQKAEGGRICGKCQNLMTDFTKMSWSEIERKHTETPGQVCGMYSQKQLNHWGHEAPSVFSSCSKSAVILSSIFTALNFQPVEAKPLDISGEEIYFSPVEWRGDSIPEQSEKVIKPFKIKGIVEGDGEPLIGVNVVLKNKSIGVSTDVSGQFILEIPDSIKQEERILEISYFGFVSQEIDFSSMETDSENAVDLKVIGVLTNEEIKVISFGVRKPSRWQRFKNWVRNVFR